MSLPNISTGIGKIKDVIDSRDNPPRELQVTSFNTTRPGHQLNPPPWSSCATCARATGSTASSNVMWRSTSPDTTTSKSILIPIQLDASSKLISGLMLSQQTWRHEVNPYEESPNEKSPNKKVLTKEVLQPESPKSPLILGPIIT